MRHITEFHVLDMELVGDEIWYPSEVVRFRDEQWPAGAPSRRWHFKASSVIPIASDVDETAYDLTLPPQYHVQDHRFDISYETTGELKVLQCVTHALGGIGCQCDFASAAETGTRVYCK